MINLQPGQQVVHGHEIAERREHAEVLHLKGPPVAFLVEYAGHALGLESKRECDVPLVDGVGDGQFLFTLLAIRNVEKRDDFLQPVGNLLVCLVGAHARRLGVRIRVDSREKLAVEVVPTVGRAV